jgi:transcriptional regulator with XRE-family HTH domain
MKDMDAVRRRLIVQRAALGLTLWQVGEAMGISAHSGSYVSKLERGVIPNPGIDTVKRWANALQMTLKVTLEDAWGDVESYPEEPKRFKEPLKE